MHTLRSCLIALFVAGTIAVGLASPASAATPSVNLSPLSGPVGTSVIVTGKSFPINTKGSVSIGTTVLAAVKTGSKGGFRVTIKIPALVPGSVKVVARIGGAKAGRWFNVTTTTTTTTIPTTPTTTTTTTTIPGSSGTWWRPTPGMTWQWQLTGLPIDTGVAADIYDIDLFDNSASTVATLHNKGRRVICYLSAGSWEDWRPDSSSFPSAVLGRTNGWPGERWLDIRALDVLMPIMEARFDLCRAKGFDAVEVDNVDGYANNSGFALTGTDQLTYNRRLAQAAHERGLAIALKNDVDQIAALVDDFDLAINEECAAYNECGTLKPFISAGKAVLHAEYDLDPAKFCPTSATLKLSSIRKNLDLDAWLQTCP